ncbi:MAG: PD40 domain-containing protein [Bacteroidetes bacterium]|nr:PD40 domain-containing protein [Bacteroidota bacterium]
MTRILMMSFVFLLNNLVMAQNKDTLFEKRLSAFTWMPDGNAIILNVLKIDKTEKSPPFPKKFKFIIQSGTVELLPIDGGGLNVSPDGNSVAYIKQVNGKDQICLYHFTQKEDKVLVNDTLKKYAVSWSPDGKNLVYNIQTGKGANAKVEICTYNIQADRIKQVTENSVYKCYTPSWNIKSNKIVYTLEKGDKRDQIYLTDNNGSFHTNLINDTTTHNYSPFWMNEKTIIYIQAPGDIMTMKIDGSQKRSLDGISTTQFRYNRNTNSIIYLGADGDLMIYDLKSKTRKVLIKQNQIDTLFNESYYNR